MAKCPDRFGEAAMYSTLIPLYRQHLHRNEQGILEEYKNINKVWSEQEYAYISCYLGDEYANDLRQAELARQEEERMYYESQLHEVLDFQRNELLEKLKHTRQEFLLGESVDTTEMCYLLEISRAFVYSYFNNEVDREGYGIL